MAGTQAPAMLRDVAARIHDLREISGFSLSELARLTDVSEQDCARYEAGAAEMPFTFVHKCALAFGVDIVELIEGTSPRLSSYTVTRKGQGEVTTDIKGVEMRNLAPFFRKKIVEPYSPAIPMTPPFRLLPSTPSPTPARNLTISFPAYSGCRWATIPKPSGKEIPFILTLPPPTA